MFCNLTKEDCAVIYYALGCMHAANLQARIGQEGELLEKGDGHLFKGDAKTIYDALSEERERVLQGAYDGYPGEVEKSGSITFAGRDPGASCRRASRRCEPSPAR